LPTALQQRASGHETLGSSGFFYEAMIAGIGKINSTPPANQNQKESSVLALQASQELTAPETTMAIVLAMALTGASIGIQAPAGRSRTCQPIRSHMPFSRVLSS
jgi:hypothetical protein